MSLDMDSGIRTINPHRLNKGDKGFSLQFLEGSLDQLTPEEGWQVLQLKHCNNKKKMRTMVHM